MLILDKLQLYSIPLEYILCLPNIFLACVHMMYEPSNFHSKIESKLDEDSFEK